MKLDLEINLNIDLNSSNLKELYSKLEQIISKVTSEFFNATLLLFANYYMEQINKPFSCSNCNNKSHFIWKTRTGKLTSLQTIFGLVQFNQLQVQCKECSHKMYITRELLGVERQVRIPLDTIKRFGLIGALTPFRVAKKIGSMFGVKLDKMTIWRSVQKLGKSINFNLDPHECGWGEADGTGIPINGIKKRGKEMKVFVQLKKSGGVRIAGLTIGNYDSQWEKLFQPIIPTLRKFSRFLLVTDGDTSILKGLKGKVTVLFQRCLWHIPHQFKWYLWNDGVKRKSEDWIKLLSQLIDICNVKYIDETEARLKEIVDLKKKRLEAIITTCKNLKYHSCCVYLENAKKNMFVSIENRLEGKTTSHAERVMKTINKRVNVGKWSTSGVLNAMKIRLAYYYNEFDV